jgi:4-hydroxy-tetrahydrodipicolinate reductase
MSRKRVVQIGVGSLGERLLAALAGLPDVSVTVAYDVDPRRIGETVATPVGRIGIARLDVEHVVALRPHVAVVSTSSRAGDVVPLAMELARRGIAVVTTCEELAWPTEETADVTQELDDVARESFVPVIATGVNPGFVMDFLPIVLSGVTRDVRRVEIARVLDAAKRREAFQAKVGVGLDLEAFQARVAAGGFGHAGLRASGAMVAAGLGLEVDRWEETFEPVLAAGGKVLGVAQTAVGLAGDEPRVTLSFRAVAGEPDPHDAIAIDGTPPVRLRLEGGIDGDEGTISVVLNVLQAVLSDSVLPGLRTMLDLAHFRARGKP